MDNKEQQVGCIAPGTIVSYDPAFPVNDPVMYVTEFNGKLYCFHQNSTWATPPLPWYKRLWHRIKYYAKKAAGWLTDE